MQKALRQIAISLRGFAIPAVCKTATLLQVWPLCGDRRSANTMKTKKLPVILAAILSFGVLVFWSQAKTNGDATTQPATQPSEAPAQIEKSASSRADSIVRSLNIDDSAKAARVHDILVDHAVAMYQWHQTNDARVKQLNKTKDGSDELSSIQATRQTLHDAFLAKLSAELTPEQIDTVKEKLTGGQMMATVRNYPVIVPNLTDDDKAMILKILMEAREEAMDSNSRTERIAIFKKYKGKVNNYLNAHGHNVAQAYKDWGAAQKAKQAGTTTQPAANQAEN